jgi:hypothetical protein
MFALPPKADIVQHSVNVRFVPKADIPAYADLVFTPSAENARGRQRRGSILISVWRLQTSPSAGKFDV